jgi:trafficking protein particle complex subunit 5
MLCILLLICIGFRCRLLVSHVSTIYVGLITDRLHTYQSHIRIMSRSTSNTASSILDRPLGRPNVGGRGGEAPTTAVSLSMFAYLFSELVQYYQNRVDSISELERRLESSGYSVGLRVLELLAIRGTGGNMTRAGLTSDYRRETKLMNILQFISTTVWKSLFHKPADSLERSIDHADEYMIVDYAPITRYVA